MKELNRLNWFLEQIICRGDQGELLGAPKTLCMTKNLHDEALII